MLQVIAILLLICLAIYATRQIQLQRDVFVEERQTTAAQFLVWLYPLPFILPVLDHLFWGLFFPVPIAALFFAPAMAVATVNRKRFDRSGNPRVKPARNAMDHVVTFGIMGV